MPFTISHAAAVLPLRRLTQSHLPLAALMVGSMSPDFPYFLPGEADRVFTHSIAGVFWFCWPVSLAVWFVFVRALEQPTFALLPQSLSARFASSDRALTFKSLALASVAVIAGALTHLLWDSFTHRGTVMVETFPALHSVAFHYNGWRIRWFMVLQHLSSLAGMLILVVWAWRLPPSNHPVRTLPPASHATRVWAAVILIAMSGGLAIAGFLMNADTWFARRLFHFAIGGVTGWVLAWFALAIYLTVPSRRA